MAKNDPFGKPADDEEFSLDLTDVSSGYNIPAGDYPAKVVSIEQGQSKAGNPMFTWVFALIGDKFPGREFKNFTALTPAAMFKVAETLQALDVGAAGKVVNFKKADVLNKQVMLQIEDDEYNGEKSSRIKKVKRHPDGPKVVKGAAGGGEPPVPTGSKKKKINDEEIPF